MRWGASGWFQMSGWLMLEWELPAARPYECTDSQETTLVVVASVGSDICTDTEQMPVLLYQLRRMPRKLWSLQYKPQHIKIFSHFSCFLTQGVCSIKLTSVFLCYEVQPRKALVGKAQYRVRISVMIQSTSDFPKHRHIYLPLFSLVTYLSVKKVEGVILYVIPGSCSVGRGCHCHSPSPRAIMKQINGLTKVVQFSQHKNTKSSATTPARSLRPLFLTVWFLDQQHQQHPKY